MRTFKQILTEKEDYVIRHRTYRDAVSEIEKFAKKRGYTLDDETDSEDIGGQMFDLVGNGPKKPSDGKTNRFSFELYKNNKKQKKRLHAQVYGSDKSYELNMYVS